MTIAMKALRACYNPEEGKEYSAGETFTVQLESTARRMTRGHRAEAVEGAKPITDLPKRAAVSPETEIAAEPVQQEAEPEAPVRPQTYSRRDMAAEPAGQTGPAKRSPSSRQARPRKGKR